MAAQKKTNIVRLATHPGSASRVRASKPPRERARATETADYFQRIELYAQKIRQTTDIRGIIDTLEEALSETRALHTANEMAAAHQQVVCAEQRIERLKSELELVNRLVREDQLTRAMNRRGLDEALKLEIARAVRAGTPLCVALVDIDNFKDFNDVFGHQAGDQVLVHLVAVIQDTIRTNDLVGRYGGEEFLVLLPGSSIETACEVTERLRRQLSLKPVVWEGRELPVTFSGGVAALQPDESESSLISRADKAMYNAKLAGKNRITVANK